MRTMFLTFIKMRLRVTFPKKHVFIFAARAAINVFSLLFQRKRSMTYLSHNHRINTNASARNIDIAAAAAIITLGRH